MRAKGKPACAGFPDCGAGNTMRSTHPQRQRGAVIVTTCLMLMLMLGFIGLALDFGRAFVIKSELQTAMDACALSAAQELDFSADAIAFATSAGITAGNRNRIHFQSANWAGDGMLTSSDITFLDASYNPTTVPASAKYAKCLHTHPSVSMWLMNALGFFFGDTATYPAARDVGALAVATRANAQSTCPIPVALRPKTGHEGDPVGSDYGFTRGEWFTVKLTPGGFGPGQAGWTNLDGSNSANETVKEMNGKCGVRTNDPLGTPGTQANVTDVWNYRFGIYRNNSDPSQYGTPGTSTDFNERPDFSGYSYTSANWRNASGVSRNAWDGDKSVYGRNPTADNFVAKRASFASCADTGTQVRGGTNSCEGITGLSLNGFTKLAAPGPSAPGGHFQYGVNRRIVLLPVESDTQTIKDFACALMLQPLSIPSASSVQMEYIGNAGEPGSPCTTNGLPGGVAGPLVPVLVQ